MISADIIERRALAPGLILFWLSAREISHGARPGQFVMALPSEGLDPFLPRALWLHRLRDGESGEECALLVQERGRGSRLLAARLAGQQIHLTGPYGRPLPMAAGCRRLLLVGEGVAIAPLVWLADEEAARSRSVTMLLVAAPDALPYPPDLLHAEVEVVVADPGNGPGSLSSLLPDLAAWTDQIVISTVGPQHRRIGEILRALPFRRPCSVLQMPPMPCGAGFCGVCAVTLRRRSLRLACVDGPAFDLRDLV